MGLHVRVTEGTLVPVALGPAFEKKKKKKHLKLGKPFRPDSTPDPFVPNRKTCQPRDEL